MTYLDYLPEIGEKTLFRYSQALAALTYCPEIREKVEGNKYVVFYTLEGSVYYLLASEESAFSRAKSFGYDCQIFKLLDTGKVIAL